MKQMLKNMVYALRGEKSLETLKKRGLKCGEQVFINFGCVFDSSFLHLISIGNRVTFAPRVHVLAHDASMKRAIGFTSVGMVKIGDDCFIGANAIILPGVTIGNNVVIGAGSVVTHDIQSNSVAVGNPARVIGSYDEYVIKMNKMKENCPVFEKEDLATIEGKSGMVKKLIESKRGFIS